VGLLFEGLTALYSASRSACLHTRLLFEHRVCVARGVGSARGVGRQGVWGVQGVWGLHKACGKAVLRV
jgi:hypothetical protein